MTAGGVAHVQVRLLLIGSNVVETSTSVIAVLKDAGGLGRQNYILIGKTKLAAPCVGCRAIYRTWQYPVKLGSRKWLAIGILSPCIIVPVKSSPDTSDSYSSGIYIDRGVGNGSRTTN